MRINKSESHVAIIVDNPEMSAILQTSLQQDGLRTSSFGSGASFLNVLDRLKPDVCLIDLNLPAKDGLKVMDVVLTSTEAATILISGDATPEEKITALKSGADDYVVEPIEPNEVVARVHAVLRRTKRAQLPDKSNDIAIFGDWEIDFNTYKLSYLGKAEKEERTIYLSHGEAAVLKIFVENPNRLLSRSQILDQITDDPDISFDRSVDVRISRLRSKIEEDPRNPVLIKTVYGAGYIFVSQIIWS